MTELTSLTLVGPKTASALSQLGIHTGDELLHFYPRRYLDFSHTLPISKYDLLSTATYSGAVTNFQNIYSRSHKNIQKATITDSTGSLDLIWFNSPYLSKIIKPNQTICVAGLVTLYQNKPTIIAPVIGNKTGRIVPVYHQTLSLKSNQVEKIIHLNQSVIFQNIVDPLPTRIINKYHLSPLSSALKEIHFPSSQDNITLAQARLSLSQSLSLLSTSLVQKNILAQKSVVRKMILVPEPDFLPYQLSPSQKDTWLEVKTDLLKKTPCHRLISGDVGSGKTIIALLAAHMASANNQMSLIIAPTQVLAQQHFEFFKKTLPQYPIYYLDNKAHKIPANAIIISTHTAFYKDSQFLNKISLLIIDEQHKFGVIQRNFLNTLPHPPHTISLTATPIPRTLALSVYGHLDISYLDHLSHWQPVKTFLVTPDKQNNCYQWLNRHIQTTRQQAFIVCPLIEDSDSQTTIRSVTGEFTKLQAMFPHLSLGLIHSQIKESVRQTIFDKFNKNKIAILVTTPIIEVGIDFPNATTIVIQSAERFGLASLHQLRGRVGRGLFPGYCYLFSNTNNPRLQYLTTHFEGQALAEFDLRSRGQGQLFSTLQHGHFPLDPASIALAAKIISDLLIQKFDLTKLISGDNSATTLPN